MDCGQLLQKLGLHAPPELASAQPPLGRNWVKPPILSCVLLNVPCSPSNMYTAPAVEKTLFFLIYVFFNCGGVEILLLVLWCVVHGRVDDNNSAYFLSRSSLSLSLFSQIALYQKYIHSAYFSSWQRWPAFLDTNKLHKAYMKTFQEIGKKAER